MYCKYLSVVLVNVLKSGQEIEPVKLHDRSKEQILT